MQYFSRFRHLCLARRAKQKLRQRTIRKAKRKVVKALKSGGRVSPIVVSLWTGESVQRAICTGAPSFAPDVICFELNQQETLKFLESVREKLTVLTDRKGRSKRGWVRHPKGRRKLPEIRSFIDFSRIKFISTSASVVLASMYDRARRVSGRVPPTVNMDKWSDAAFLTLYELGFFNIIGHVEDTTERYSDSSSGDIRTMAMITGNNSSELEGACQRILELSSFIGDAEPLRQDVKLALNSAIGEAMSNVANHAYPGTFQTSFDHVEAWWISASADRAKRTLSVVVYDQGASIPWTLPNRSWAAALAPSSLFSAISSADRPQYPHDADYIEFAMGEGRSQTGQSGRGEGLPQMRDLVKICGAGSLRILSRGGHCCYTPDQNMFTQALPLPIEGTLIEWEMHLPRAV